MAASDERPYPEPCEGCYYATGELMVCAGFCDLVHDERSAQTARALYDFGVSRGRSFVRETKCPDCGNKGYHSSWCARPGGCSE